MAEYRLSPKAQRDIESIFDYTEKYWGIDQARRYTDRLAEACAELAAAPNLGQACSHIRPSYRRRAVEQHLIYFRPTSYGIAIVRFLHHRMDLTRQF